MAWIYLGLAGLGEIVWASLMPQTQGFTRLLPSLVCLAFIAISLYLLSVASRTLPIGTAYAVWVGIGAMGTAIYGMVLLGEDRSLGRILCLLLILAGVVGLKLLSPAAES